MKNPFKKNSMMHTNRQELVKQIEEMHNPPRPMIEDAYNRAVTLVSQMESRKAYWEGVIVNATEELRQTNVVLEGGRQLLTTISAGMPQQPPSADDTTALKDEMDAEFARILGETFSQPNTHS